MKNLKVNNKIWFLIAFISSALTTTGCVANTNSCDDIFICKLEGAELTQLELCKSNEQYILKKIVFKSEQANSATQLKLNSVEKSSYHRALVDEHSLSFQFRNKQFTLSDYHSEELGSVDKQLNVTIKSQSQITVYECDLSTSFSDLSTISDTVNKR